jgi:class 3 adenylate cyclase
VEPRVTSSATRSLLTWAARNGEFAIHIMRGLLWILLFMGVTSWLGIPGVVAVVAGVALGGLWLLAQLGLESGVAFRPTRYLLILADGLVVLGAIASREAGTGIGALAALFGATPSAPDVRPFIPALLVFLALSGAVRADLGAAFVAVVIAASAYAYYTFAFAVPLDEAIFVGAVVLLAGIIGLNAARITRLILLSSQEQAVLEAFLPEELSRGLVIGGGGLERSGRLEEVTLLTCDIRGFTKTSEALTPVDTVAFVNRYLEEVCPAIVNAGGVIDKFMGDGVLAFFEGGGHAGRALLAARGVVAAAGRVKGPTGERIRVGVAVHTGVVLVGTIGPRSRREYTIISDTVNTLSRLEELNKKFNSVICASDRSLSEVPVDQRVGFQGPETVPIRGRAEPVIVHYYLGPATQEEAEKLAEAPALPTIEELKAQTEPAQVVYWKD